MLKKFKEKFSIVWAALDLSTKRRMYIVSFLMVVISFSEVLTILSALPMITSLIGGDDGEVVFSFYPDYWNEVIEFMPVLFFVGAVIISALARLLLMYKTTQFINEAGREISIKVFEKVLNQPYQFHLQTNSSEIVSITAKSQRLTTNLFLPIVICVISFVLSIVILIVLTLLTSGLVIFLGSFGVLAYIVSITLTKRKVVEMGGIINDVLSKRIKITQEALGAIRDVIMDHAQESQVSIYDYYEKKYRGAQINLTVISMVPRYVIEILGVILVVIVAYIIGDESDGVLNSIPIIGAFVLGIQRLLPHLQAIYLNINRVLGSLFILDDIVGLLELKNENYISSKNKKLLYNNKIQLKNVGFSYSGSSNKMILNEVNLEINKGLVIGISGKSGSGKSTLIDIIMGLQEPTTGEILIDQVALESSNLNNWRRKVSHISQSIYLSDSSIASNIAFGIPSELIDFERVKECAKDAMILDYIESLPEGFDANIGERGVSISGGQRQRIGIARALYKTSEILIFDEATNALDPTNEKMIIKNIINDSNRKGRTTILISHNEEIIKECEMVVYLKNGRTLASRNDFI